MKRFDHEFENNDDDDESFDDDKSQPASRNNYNDFIEGDQIQQDILELGYLELDQKLVNKAIKVCEGSMFWNFYSIQTRLSMISRAYTRLKKMIDA
jgi:hypothetical protein